jgi:DNA helicase-2/ATP-dependent DNA helicase PcrA
LNLSFPSNNICIVGDEDQSLYRFRGATVRNILEFKRNYKECQQIILNTNYRSHPSIIQAYNNFMNMYDWSNPTSNFNFRFNKKINPNPNIIFPNYQGILSLSSSNKYEEGLKFANLVKELKENNVIEDYSEIVLLLHSVRLYNSGHYIEALERLKIPYFVPRAKRYFENKEVKSMIGCYALILNFQENIISNIDQSLMRNLLDYFKNCEDIVRQSCHISIELQKYIHNKRMLIQKLKKGETTDIHILEIFFDLLSYKPFSVFMKNENSARNLAKLSQLLNIFQSYYHIDIITEKNRDWILKMLFVSFLKFLIELGIDEYEDSANPLPRGHVQIMTIHQSKGLEFPVVVVGSLDKKNNEDIKLVDKYLTKFSNKPIFEPHDRIHGFDTMRQYYVAFSRAANLLILSSSGQVNKFINPLWNIINNWSQVDKQLLFKQKFKPKFPFIPKKSYSLTSHINIFEVCPLKYKYYKEYDFSPSRSAATTFGSLVHSTIDEIHNLIKIKKKDIITNEYIRDNLLEHNYKSLILAGMRPLSVIQKHAALEQIINYYIQNFDILAKIVDTEVELSIEKDRYILSGKMDLIFEENGFYNILDFKTDQKLKEDDHLLEIYYKQLYLYAYILKQRYGVYPNKLFIYWTSVKEREEALTEIPFTEKEINNAAENFNSIVTLIQNNEFKVQEAPKPKVCVECDFRRSCTTEGIIKLRNQKS